MKRYRQEVLGENLLYFMVWVVVFLVPVLNSGMMAEAVGDFGVLQMAWRKIYPFFFIFLVHNYLIARLLVQQHRYGWYGVASVAIVAVVFLFIDIFERKVLGNTHETIIRAQLANIQRISCTDFPFHWNLIIGCSMNGLNASIKLIYQSISNEKKMTELKERNLQTEMEYLKYQVNPHFFMNTLNNIHALIDIDTEGAKEAVIDLSKMMRYVLYDSGSDRIPLQKDIHFIENYIELMRIRYTNDVDIKFTYSSNIPKTVMVPPLLFIVYVENAFKHGVSYNNSSFIDININYDDGKVTFMMSNSRHTAPADTRRSRKSGIGLVNANKRLDLIFGNRYSMEVDNTSDDRYYIKLIIPSYND